MVEDKPDTLPLECCRIEISETFALVVGHFALYPNDDAAISQDLGQPADLRNDFWTPAGEAVHRHAGTLVVLFRVQGGSRPEHKGSFLFVTGIQYSLQLLVSP